MQALDTLTSINPPVAEWTPWFLSLYRSEYGVTVADWSEPVGGTHADHVRRWLAEWRGHGRGAVMPIEDLRRYAAGRWFGAAKTREIRIAQPYADRILCEVLNDERSGLLVVPLRPGK